MAFMIRSLTNRNLVKCFRYDFTRTLTTTTSLAASNTKSTSNGSEQKSKAGSTSTTDKRKPLDDIEYFVKFQDIDVKKIFKQFYSVYGPLFVACHIGVSLMSLGFFCSITWFVVDPTKLIPSFMEQAVGNMVLHSAETGGKFVVAYAIHKIILPLRLGASIWLTRRIASRVNFFKRRIDAMKKN